MCGLWWHSDVPMIAALWSTPYPSAFGASSIYLQRILAASLVVLYKSLDCVVWTLRGEMPGCAEIFRKNFVRRVDIALALRPLGAKR